MNQLYFKNYLTFNYQKCFGDPDCSNVFVDYTNFLSGQKKVYKNIHINYKAKKYTIEPYRLT